jgi:hypothetical protein
MIYSVDSSLDVRRRHAGNMNRKSACVLLIYLVATAILVLALLLNVRDYQDSWILENITVEAFVYVLAFSIFVAVCRDNRILAIACASFVIILNAIPNMKYELFQGTFDSVTHYAYTRDLVSLAHVPSTGSLAATYQDFPGMHIFTGSLSIVLGVSINVAIKIVTSMIIGIIPLMTYVATNHVFEPNVQRFMVIASGLPTVMVYELTGTGFALPFFFFIICLILVSARATSGNKRQYVIVLLVSVFALIFSHAATTLYLIVFLGVVVLLLKFSSIERKPVIMSYQKVKIPVLGTLIIMTISFATRLNFESGNVLNMLTEAGVSILSHSGTSLIPATFFKVPLFAKVIFFGLSYANDAVIALLCCAGIFVLFLKPGNDIRKACKEFHTFLLCLLCTILTLLALQFLLGFSEIEYVRLMSYGIVLSPFLVGPFLWYIHKYFSQHRLGVVAVVLLLFACISVSMLSIYPYQPVAPMANVLSPNLPNNEYVFDFRSVNTVYQVNMVFFAQSFSTSRVIVAADTVTRCQIVGFANDAFNSRTLYYSPLDHPNLDWTLFLCHYDGKAGPLNEPLENRTSERLNDLKNSLGNDVVYDNGQSFIIAR